MSWNKHFSYVFLKPRHTVSRVFRFLNASIFHFITKLDQSSHAFEDSLAACGNWWTLKSTTLSLAWTNLSEAVGDFSLTNSNGSAWLWRVHLKEWVKKKISRNLTTREKPFKYSIPVGYAGNPQQCSSDPSGASCWEWDCPKMGFHDCVIKWSQTDFSKLEWRVRRMWVSPIWIMMLVICGIRLTVWLMANSWASHGGRREWFCKRRQTELRWAAVATEIVGLSLSNVSGYKRYKKTNTASSRDKEHKVAFLVLNSVLRLCEFNSLMSQRTLDSVASQVCQQFRK